MAELVIHLEGGLVQWAYKRGKGAINGCVIVDFDTEGADPDEITSIKGEDGVVEGILHDEGIVPLKKGCDIDKLIAAYDKAQKKEAKRG
jgi:hypothetical protein